MRAKVSCIVFVSALAPGLLPAQPADPEAPPTVLSIFREEVKPGRMAVHEKISTGFIAALAKASPDMHWIGLTPITGDPNVVLYVDGLPSFKALEDRSIKMQTALAQDAALKAEMDRLDGQSGDIMSSQRSSMYVYRPALSFRAPRMADVAKSRLMAITTTRVKPGRIPDYMDYTRSLNAAREKAGASWVSTAVYQVAAGGPGGTFLTFSAVKSLAELDDTYAKGDERQKAIDTALGGDQIAKMRRDLISDILIEPSTTNVFLMSRTESRPSAQFAAYDPDFWSAKPAATGKALATKKEGAKDAPKQ